MSCEEMRQLRLVLLIFCMVTMSEALTEVADVDWRESLGLGKETVTKLHFYFHDILSGDKPTAVRVAQAATTSSSWTLFGAVMMADDPLTEGPDLNSKVVGRAQGLYGSSGQEEMGLLMVMDYSFTEPPYNGSSISILGRNRVLNTVRELPVLGGTGMFRFGRGVAIARTYRADFSNGDAIVEYNVTVVH
ncbi:dirigent protein 23-like [Magnolia sinica]|uniref:dirigent protein 23-like n=1 Tax=Magnolia sinica TaxID=86752 RepID=UPI002657F96B|nr:dirigent protein 23-like [Magnolia sinica]